MSKKILLNGVDGNFGSRCAAVLLEKWPHEDLIFDAPTPKGLEKYAKMGIETRIAHFNNPDGLPQAHFREGNLRKYGRTPDRKQDLYRRLVRKKQRCDGPKYPPSSLLYGFELGMTDII